MLELEEVYKIIEDKKAKLQNGEIKVCDHKFNLENGMTMTFSHICEICGEKIKKDI